MADAVAPTRVLLVEDDPTYARVLREFDLQPRQFVMIGNSLRSDIEPVLQLGGWGVHMPYHVTWAHETEADVAHDAPRLRSVVDAAGLPAAVADIARAAASMNGR